MKKLTRLAMFLLTTALLFASCKAHENCPAYGQMNKPKVHHTILG